MKNAHLKIFAVVACMAIAAPAGAVAKRGDKGGKDRAPKAKLVGATVKGAVTSHDAGVLAVSVTKASGQAKACKGRELTFDVSKARFRTADHNGDGMKDAADVLVGHAVKVQGRVSVTKGRKTACSVADGQVLAAKRVQNRTKPAKVKDDESSVDAGDELEEGEDLEDEDGESPDELDDSEELADDADSDELDESFED